MQHCFKKGHDLVVFSKKIAFIKPNESETSKNWLNHFHLSWWTTFIRKKLFFSNLKLAELRQSASQTYVSECIYAAVSEICVTVIIVYRLYKVNNKDTSCLLLLSFLPWSCVKFIVPRN